MWLPLLADPQAVTVAGLPLLVISDPSTVVPGALDLLQQRARAGGLPGMAVAACRGAPPEAGFTLQTRYHSVPGYTAEDAGPRDYRMLIDTNRERWAGSPAQPDIPVLTVGWDKRPWDGPAGGTDGGGPELGWHFTGRSPERFSTSLDETLAWMDAHPADITAERLLLLYAWNELGEGGYLVPTRGDPEARYLATLRDRLQGPGR